MKKRLTYSTSFGTKDLELLIIDSIEYFSNFKINTHSLISKSGLESYRVVTFSTSSSSGCQMIDSTIISYPLQKKFTIERNKYDTVNCCKLLTFKIDSGGNPYVTKYLYQSLGDQLVELAYEQDSTGIFHLIAQTKKKQTKDSLIVHTIPAYKNYEHYVIVSYDENRNETSRKFYQRVMGEKKWTPIIDDIYTYRFDQQGRISEQRVRQKLDRYDKLIRYSYLD